MRRNGYASLLNIGNGERQSLPEITGLAKSAVIEVVMAMKLNLRLIM